MEHFDYEKIFKNDFACIDYNKYIPFFVLAYYIYLCECEKKNFILNAVSKKYIIGFKKLIKDISDNSTNELEIHSFLKDHFNIFININRKTLQTNI
ncbi:hypothetical protein GVAV_002005 [Gurleya vavrai]